MPCWHQQLLCLLAPFFLCGWTHQAGSSAIKLLSWLLLEAASSGEENHIYQQANEKVTLEKPSDVENNNLKEKTDNLFVNSQVLCEGDSVVTFKQIVQCSHFYRR